MMDFALFSGGHDSLVSTHYLMENEYCEKVLHLDTNTGIPKNEEFVVEVCEEYGWPLRIEESPYTLLEIATELGENDEGFGFPGPSFHSVMYRCLKERQLQRIATEHDEPPHYWTGVRKGESERRMKTVTDAVKEEDRWTWHAPIRNWTKERCEDYIEEWNIPRNSVVENIHRSGECYCGCYANRDEELIELQAHYPEHYEWLMDVEQQVREEIGTERERAYWGHDSISGSDFLHLRHKYDPEDDMTLCRDCEQETYNSAKDWD